MKKINLSRIAIPLTIALQFLLMSCSDYYKAVSTPLKNNAQKAAALDSLKQANRSFILRNGANAFYVSSPVPDAVQNKMGCTLDTLFNFNKLHLTKGRGGKMCYKKTNPADLSVLNEVHIYIEPDDKIVLGKNNILLDKIQKIEVIEKDKRRTTGSYLLGGIGITAGIIVIVAAIFASTFNFGFGLGGG